MNKNQYYWAIFYGAFTAALIDSLPMLNLTNCLCCAGIMLGGVFPVLILHRQHPDHTFFSTPELIHLGLTTGLVAAFLSFVFQYIVFQVYGNWQVQWLSQAIESMEEIPPMWEEIYNELQKPEYQGFAGLTILIRNLIIFPIFTMLGAFLMNNWLKRKSD